MELVIIALLVFLLIKGGALSSLGVGGGAIAPPPAVAPLTAAQISASIAQGTALTATEASQGIALAQQGTQAGLLASNLSGSTASEISSAIPIVGAAVSLVASVLIAQSQKRAKEAQNENQAVANGVPGWDAAVSQIVAGYNNGTLSVANVQALLATVMSNFWNETGPQIQPGRNGCNSGANCADGETYTANAIRTGEGGFSGGPNLGGYCSGNIGAACCVGCVNLQLSADNMSWAVAQADRSGTATSAYVTPVDASKYGGVNRAAYTVIFTPFVPMAIL